MKFLFVFLFIFKVINANPTPIVLWHGMGDTCCLSISLGSFKVYLQTNIPGVYVNSLRIGNNVVEDFENGYFLHPDKQIEMACEQIAQDDNLKDGFNAIGFSQGGQFIRALIQRCGHNLPPIKNFISMGGQHQGVYGLPHCGAISHKTCDTVRRMLNYAAYYKFVQKNLVQATYWHDPLNEQEYKENSEFLADINNELSINQTYVSNLAQLDHFVMILFANDTIVQPRETEWFGFYKPGQAKDLMTLQESDLYVQDRLGLKKMNEDNKLVFLKSDGDHLQFNDDWFKQNVIKPYLTN